MNQARKSPSRKQRKPEFGLNTVAAACYGLRKAGLLAIDAPAKRGHTRRARYAWRLA